MKLKKLSIENIASIERAVIEFDKAPLADERLFLITGETGSGKSTIIDCLCLALYGSTPRMNAAKKVTYGDIAADESLTTDDPRQLMRRGSAQANVELTFDDNNGTPFVATWEVHRAHGKVDGRLSKVARTLMTADGVTPEQVYSRKTDIDKAVMELIGMDVDQFFRTVVLAQGKFAEFLNSDENVKSALLEKMTGTAIYSQVGSKIYEVYVDKKNQLEIIEGQMQGITLLDEQERTAMTDQIAQLDQQQEETKQRHDLAAAMTAWLAEKAGFEKLLTEQRATLERKQQEQQAPEHLAQQALANDWDATVEPRLKLREMTQDNREIERLKQQEPALQQEFDTLCAALRAAARQLEVKQRELDAITAFISQQEGNKEMYAAIGHIKSALKSYKAGKANIIDFAQKLADEKNRLPSLEAWVTAMSDELKNREQNIRDLQQQLQDMGVEALNAHKEALQHVRQDLLTFKDKLTAVARCEESLESAKKKLAGEQANLEQANATIGDKRRLQAMAQETLDRQMGWNELLMQAQRTLHEGDACPVCGNIITQVLTPKSEDELEAYRQQLKQANDELRGAESLIQSSQRLIKTYREQVQEAQMLLSKALDDRETHWDRTRQGLNNCGLQTGEIVDTNGADGLIKDIDDKTVSLNTRLEQASQLSQAINEQQRQYNEAMKAFNQQTIDLNNVKNSIEHQRQVIETCEKEVQERVAELNGLLVMDDWQQQALDGDGFIDALTAAAGDYQRKVEDQQKLTRFIELRRAAIPAMQTARESITGLQDNHLDSDNVPDNLDREWHDFEKKYGNWTAAVRDKQGDVKRSQEMLDAFLARHEEMTLERLQELDRYEKAAITAIKTAQQELKDAINTMQGQITEMERQQRDHLTKKPAFAEEDPQRLDTIIQACRLEMDERTKTITELRARLQADEENKKSKGRLQEEKLKAEAECSRWERFNKMLGSADGKTFRKIAQSYILGDLLASANGFLRQFNNRYELEADPGRLTILVRDLVQGDKTSVSTLSGGESFMVSLALALALSNLSGKVFSMDTLFIDEGFGSLSPAYLDKVMETLNRLYDLGGRRVGIISHVEMLKERVLTQVQVLRDPDNNTVSRVDVTVKS